MIENLQIVLQRVECKSHDPTGERSGNRVSRFGPRCRSNLGRPHRSALSPPSDGMIATSVAEKMEPADRATSPSKTGRPGPASKVRQCPPPDEFGRAESLLQDPATVRDLGRITHPAVAHRIAAPSRCVRSAAGLEETLRLPSLLRQVIVSLPPRPAVDERRGTPGTSVHPIPCACSADAAVTSETAGLFVRVEESAIRAPRCRSGFERRGPRRGRPPAPRGVPPSTLRGGARGAGSRSP